MERRSFRPARKSARRAHDELPGLRRHASDGAGRSALHGSRLGGPAISRQSRLRLSLLLTNQPKMKITTFALITAIAAAAAFALPACSSTGTTDAASVASSINAAINTVATTLADSGTLSATETTITTLANSGAIDGSTAAALTAAAVAINTLSSAAATVTDTTSKVIARKPRAAAFDAYTAILQAHQTTIKPSKVASALQ